MPAEIPDQLNLGVVRALRLLLVSLDFSNIGQTETVDALVYALDEFTEMEYPSHDVEEIIPCHVVPVSDNGAICPRCGKAVSQPPSYTSTASEVLEGLIREAVRAFLDCLDILVDGHPFAQSSQH
ncbi:hypothetical protein TKK_0015705 [Trichogramma kaykai]